MLSHTASLNHRWLSIGNSLFHVMWISHVHGISGDPAMLTGRVQGPTTAFALPRRVNESEAIGR